MTYRALMVLASAVLLAVGGSLALTPLGATAFFGRLVAASGPDAAEALGIGVALVRLLGTAVAGLGLVAWCARGIANAEAQEAVARGLQYGSLVGFFVALAQEVSVLHSVAGAVVAFVFLTLVVAVVAWRVRHAKADPYGVISVRI